MPMEMSSLGPTVEEIVGFLGPVKIETSPKNNGFMKHGFLMGKPMENLQCHRDIYSTHMAVWLKILDTHFGMFHQSLSNLIFLI